MILRVTNIISVGVAIALSTAMPTQAAPVVNGRIYYLQADPDALVSVLPDGTDPVVSFEDPPFWNSVRIALSPDGTRVALGQYHSSNAGDERARLVVMDAADGEHQSVVLPARYTFYSSVAWNPAGTKILFTRADGPEFTYHLYSVRLDGSGVKRIGRGQMIDAEMAPDGTRIAFRDGKERLGVMRWDGTHQRLLLEDGRNFEPTWSPDSALITFARKRPAARNADIYTIAPDGTELIRLLWTPKIWESSPVWSPDATRLVFVQSGLTDLWTMAADGSDVAPLTGEEGWIYAPQWAIA